jgi:hypothetical protein
VRTLLIYYNINNKNKSNFIWSFQTNLVYLQKFSENMDKSSNVRIVGFPKETYDKKWLDTLNDRELSETACADGDTQIWGSLNEFQSDLHLEGAGRNIIDLNWIYFLND